MQPTRTAARKLAYLSVRKRQSMLSLFGLAPGGVYLATDVTTGAVCSYHTLSPLPVRVPVKTGVTRAVCFLWHFPWGRPRRVLPGTVLPWSPDFPPQRLSTEAAIRPSGS